MKLTTANLTAPGFIQLGLKAGCEPTQLMDRLKYHPEVFEFYTAPADYSPAGFQQLARAVQFVQQQIATRIIVHHPMSFQGQHLDILTDQRDNPELVAFFNQTTTQLLDMAKQLNVTVLIHGGYGGGNYQALSRRYESLAVARQVVLTRLQKWVEQADGHLVIENGITPTFMYGDATFDEQILAAKLPLACDLSHVFIGLKGNNEKLLASLARLRPLIKHYHLVDSLGQQHDSLPLGAGSIDWGAVYQQLNPKASMIYEVPDETDATCVNMLSSYYYLKRIEVEQIERQVQND